MRLASYNVESLFERAKAMNPLDPSIGREALEQHARINGLFEEPVYTDVVKDEIKDLLTKLGLAKSDDGGKFARLRQNRGKLIERNPLEVVASGRDDWVGWVELEKEPVDELATRHTAMVIRDVEAHVLAVIEADNRVALRDFSSILLSQAGATAYEHVMLIDGNDNRGIDVGDPHPQGLRHRGHPLARRRRHAHEPHLQPRLPGVHRSDAGGERIVVLVNHLKSKGFGVQSVNNARRRAQAEAVAKIYRRLRRNGQRNVAVVGDMNDTPDSSPMQPLVQDTDLRDIFEHPNFVSDGRPGTFGNGAKSSKIDYILLSPALFQKVTAGGVFRKGVWGGKNGTLFPHYDTMTKPVHQASDHAAVFADIAI